MPTAAEGIAEGLTIGVVRAKARIDAAVLPGVDVTKARRILALLEQELLDAKKRVIDEFHCVHSNPHA
ncbi:hypothetical protein [Paraburkholderia sp. GAS334]|uniref:hypothetical protein n=1 Tax=Paraburkholderia sp. GAS334 TaxID=3035131 RepID=UPI003D231713